MAECLNEVISNINLNTIEANNEYNVAPLSVENLISNIYKESISNINFSLQEIQSIINLNLNEIEKVLCFPNRIYPLFFTDGDFVFIDENNNFLII